MAYAGPVRLVDSMRSEVGAMVIAVVSAIFAGRADIRRATLSSLLTEEAIGREIRQRLIDWNMSKEDQM